jgi:hypothetical protein
VKKTVPLFLLITFLQFSTEINAANANCFPNPVSHDTVHVFKGIKWQFQTNGKIFATPAIANGTVYVGSEDNCLYAIDQNNGKLKWKFNTKGKVYSSATVFNNIVFLEATTVTTMH